MLGWVEHEKSFIKLGAWQDIHKQISGIWLWVQFLYPSITDVYPSIYNISEFHGKKETLIFCLFFLWLSTLSSEELFCCYFILSDAAGTWWDRGTVLREWGLS